MDLKTMSNALRLKKFENTRPSFKTSTNTPLSMQTARTSLFEFCGRGESKREYYHYVGGDAVAGDLSCTVTPL
jgi:hypothetical protein